MSPVVYVAKNIFNHFQKRNKKSLDQNELQLYQYHSILNPITSYD